MRKCDIIMKGGITSGVVYPLAITELASEFQFKNIGGTSAGAIAAAVAAAAEYRRVVDHGSAAGFDEIAKLPDFLAGKTDGEPNLLNLFPPTRETRGLFELAMTFAGDEPPLGKAVNAISHLLFLRWWLTLLCFLPLVLLLFACRGQEGFGILAVVVAGLALLAFGVIALAIATLLWALLVTLPRNSFGFSTGRAPEDRTLPGVTDWLHERLQTVAGRGIHDKPLTFGDLWTAGQPDADLKELADNSDQRTINLQMITTALSHGRPYRLPFENYRFAFKESEFRRYFPKAVVDHLITKAAEYQNDNEHKTNARLVAAAKANPKEDRLYPLPQPWELPVVVAARMSLSFPLLFTLVPLYAVDYTKPEEKQEYERCWFIDGGLSSNFPMSLFDQPFPRWPTFGINLAGFTEERPERDEEHKNVWMAPDLLSDHWMRFESAGDYLGAILDTIRNWHDNTQMAVPGFRDRVAHVSLTPEQGGLNLDMGETKVKRLAARGHFAGALLRERFGVQGTALKDSNWDRHRDVRYRSSMPLLLQLLAGLGKAFAQSDPPYLSYRRIIAKQSKKNKNLTRQLLRISKAKAGQFRQPNPRPELRIAPRL